VLAVTTRSPILTVLSMLTIGSIVCCIVGTLVLDGWQLNIMESVIISVAVGMSVDFVAHYSHTYLHAPESYKSDRDKCVEHTLTTMGVSVLTGAITTFVAGFFMILAQTLFFFQ
jgi:predicted RND superfamily exporter protein